MAKNKTPDPLNLPEIEAFNKVISENERFTVVAHTNPDADAYGSSLAMYYSLKAKGKPAIIVNETGCSSRYVTLPGITEIRNSYEAADWNKTCVLIVCDCGSANRVGDSLKDRYKEFKRVINIDHHHSNELFGDINLFDPSASSTAEIVYNVLAADKFLLTPQIAQLLMTGIIGDTGYFRYRSTTARTFEAAADLMRHGANPALPAEEIFITDSVNSLLFQSAALSKLEVFADGKVGVITVTDELYSRFGVGREEADILVDKIRDIKPVRIAVLIRQHEDLWRISLRSKTDKDDVSAIAASFGGGGHKMAAAFRWKKTFEELKEKLVQKLTSSVDQP